MKKLLILLLAGTIAFAACSSGGGDKGASDGGEGDTKAISCTPEDSPLSVKAENTDFDTECLAARADEAFTIALQNADELPHNISIFESKGGKSLFKGDIIQAGQSVTYNVEAIPAGKYYFQCDVHPEMNGTFITAG